MLNDQHHVKLGDFGIALPKKHSVEQAKIGRVPIRWTSPEGLKAKFSFESDVWSKFFFIRFYECPARIKVFFNHSNDESLNHLIRGQRKQ